MIFSVLPPLTVCGTCAAGALAEFAWMPALAKYSPTYATRLCISVRPSVNFRVATWWGPPISFRTGEPRKPFMQSNMICGLAPWIPLLPAQGNLESAE
jgi:hypothetical protein